MRALIAAYLDHLAELGRAPGTRKATLYWLATFERFCQERGLEFAEVAPATLAAYRTRLLWEPHTAGRLYAPASVDMALRMVRAFLRWAVSQGELRRDPAHQLVLCRPPSRPRPTWSPAEREALLAAPDAGTPLGLRDRAMLALFLNAPPLTRPQLGELDLEDYDPQTYRLNAQRGRQRRGPAELILSDGVAEILARYLTEGRPRLALLPHEPALFLTVQGGRYRCPQFFMLLRRYQPPAASFLNRAL